ncbi:MAG: histidinol dehydrogenase [Planctomycetota bacterium]
MLRIIQGNRKKLLAEVRALKERLSVLEGIQMKKSRERGRRLFGRRVPAREIVRRIVDDVRRRGDEALAAYTRRLDGVDLEDVGLRVGADEIRRARNRCPRELMRALAAAKKRIEEYQRHFAPEEKPALRAEGRILAQKLLALARVGVYVPGGEAAYPSTVLMTVVPARVAGVKEIALATPPRRDGTVHEAVLAAAALAGVKEIYRMGGAQAIAALAYGTRTVPRVDKITGPGNIFVALAKREVFGVVDVDLLAGPSEVLLLADAGANAEFLAADLAAQAEHAPGVGVLAATSAGVVLRTRRALAKMMSGLSRSQAIREALSEFSVAFVVRSLEELVDLANELAAEHVEVHTKRAGELARSIRNAGAVFVGEGTPTALGDYIAGPSHTLPTGGTSRFFSGLSAHDFVRRMSVVRYVRRGLLLDGPAARALAAAEGLSAHELSLRLRVERTR